MKIRILYLSKKGNTEKIADVITKAVSSKSEQIPPAYPCENEKLLFLGTGIYGGKPDKKMIDFCNSLDTSRVKNVALFVTSGNGVEEAKDLQEILRSKGINVLSDVFHCKGKFFVFFNRGKPGPLEFEAAEKWAKKCVEEVCDH